MFSRCEINQYFPSCIWVHEISDFRVMNERLVSEIHALRDSGTGFGGETRAWQSRDDLHTLAPFQPLTHFLNSASKGVLDFLKCSYERFDITSCWANINREDESHRLHSHPNNYLSGVYYVRAPKNCGKIVFFDPRPQASVLIPQVTERNAFNSFNYRIEPKEGLLLVFHSWFQHMVETNQSGQERISMSFNTMLRGQVGYESGRAEF